MPEYLESGIKKTSKYTRNEKDKRIPVNGDIEAVRQSIEYLQKNKNYKNNYYSFMLSFRDEEYEKLTRDDLAKIEEEYLRLYFPNHLLDEIIRYSEIHYPIIKHEPYILRNKKLDEKFENGRMVKRNPHMHICVSMENLKYTNQVKAIFSKRKNLEIKKVIDEIVHRKFNLTRESSDIELTNLTDEELIKKYNSLAKNSLKVSKGKLRYESKEEETIDVKPLESIKKKSIEIDQKELLKIDTVAKEKLVHHYDEDVRKKNAEKLKEYKSMDISIFREPLAQKFNINFQIDKETNQIIYESKKDDDTYVQKRYNIVDFLQKVIGVKYFEIIKTLDEILKIKDTPKLIKNIDENTKITLSVCRNMNFDKARSTPDKKIYYTNDGWERKEIDFKDLPYIVTNPTFSAYSDKIYKDGVRKNENVEEISNVIIYDIDNDQVQYYQEESFKMDDMSDILSEKNLAGLIIPTSNNMIPYEKNGNTYTSEKFMVILPVDKQIAPEEYLQFKANLALDLGIYKYIDQGAEKLSQPFYLSKEDADSMFFSGSAVCTEDIRTKMLLENNENRYRLEQEKRNQLLKQIEEDRNRMLQDQNFVKKTTDLKKISENWTVRKDTTHITYTDYIALQREIDVQKMAEMVLNWEFEKIESSGSYHYLRKLGNTEEDSGRMLKMTKDDPNFPNSLYHFKTGKSYYNFNILQMKILEDRQEQIKILKLKNQLNSGEIKLLKELEDKENKVNQADIYHYIDENLKLDDEIKEKIFKTNYDGIIEGLNQEKDKIEKLAEETAIDYEYDENSFIMEMSGKYVRNVMNRFGLKKFNPNESMGWLSDFDVKKLGNMDLNFDRLIEIYHKNNKPKIIEKKEEAPMLGR